MKLQWKEKVEAALNLFNYPDAVYILPVLGV